MLSISGSSCRSSLELTAKWKTCLNRTGIIWLIWGIWELVLVRVSYSLASYIVQTCIQEQVLLLTERTQALIPPTSFSSSSASSLRSCNFPMGCVAGTVTPGIWGRQHGGVRARGEFRQSKRNFLSYMMRVPVAWTWHEKSYDWDLVNVSKK